MDISTFSNILFSTENPVLPSATVMRLALQGAWAIVLGSGVMLAAGKLSRPYRLGLALCVMLWTLLPGRAAPAYWLGLAFQTPSLMSAVICLAWLLNRVRSERPPVFLMTRSPARAIKILTVLGVVLGWVLLLDTLAWLPVSVYAWGFSSAAFAAVAVVASSLWLTTRSAASVVPLVVLALFVLSRLPTGNVWDALMDPWLWVALQVEWLINVARRRMAARRSPPATRV
jgi:hypothetical protein